MEYNEKPTIHIILDRIRSAYNVGSFFRTADALNRCKIYTCGYTPRADNPKVHKTALGAEDFVPSEHFESALDAVTYLQNQKIPVFAVELTENAEKYNEIRYPPEVGLVFGNEIDGVDEEILNIVDKTIYIPMLGTKRSLNVATTGGIILFEA